MDDKAFIFHPSEKDAAAGWQDFFDFTWGYNFLPEDLKRSFKSHYLIIQIPAS